MKKTEYMASIRLYNPLKRHFYDYFDRRVWEDEQGVQFVKVNGEWTPLSYYKDVKFGGVNIWKCL